MIIFNTLEQPQLLRLNRWLNRLRGDVTGGLTAAVVALPLALAFAVASGVEPKAGLYTAIVAGIVAAIFGGSPVQITGPTGAMAVILVGIVAKYGIEKVWIAGVMAGIIQVALGIAKLGRLVKFIPYPVTAGFTNGIAVIIFCGQMNNFLGLQLPRSEHFLSGLWQTLTHIQALNWAAIMLAMVVIATKLFWPRINTTIPGSLVGLVLATAIAAYFHLDVPTIGNIPQSLPKLQAIPHWYDFSLMRELINPALALAALGSIESLLSAVVADGMTVSEKDNSDRELIGQGLANIVVPFFGGIPATGAIARTAVNVRSGGKT
jgi:SulP family sulfate permease